ncbi:hypothetical protein [Falsiphaeobacter marinintestinus]|uniref:hypothetical protein n=1 Tax=Falsiphaeobacter marinintestinus TaxID=1492905 RepID=UPI0011B51032|nr:hypothetical protein [Phaeobacter marinintestinus]
MRPICLFLAALLPVLPAPALSQQVTLSYNCDFGGVAAQLVMAVEYQQAFNPLHNFQGHISGLFPAGITIYTAGQVTSPTAQYSFLGENDFADFTDLTTNERFRVQWVLDPQRNGIWMKVNPFGQTTTYFCAFQDAR